jgi:GxxExxY protein
VHRHLGPGQLESTYQRSLEYALDDSGLAFRAQVPISAQFKGREVGEFFADLIVEDKVLIELKAVSAIAQVHRAQVISYLRATRLRLGLLINFHVPVLYRGVTRLIV